MSNHRYRFHCLAILALLTGLWGPWLPAAAGAAVPPPPAQDAPADPAEPAEPAFAALPTGCVSHNDGGPGQSLPQPIQDFTTITSSVTVSTSFNYLWNIGVLTKLTHPANGQLDLTLISPAGTRVLLAANQGGGNANVFANTNWADENAQPVTDFTFANNVTATALSPQEPLGALRGENANGTWQLVIHDGAAGNQGQLTSWNLILRSLQHAPDAVSAADFSSAGSFPMPDVGLGPVPTITVPFLPDPISAITLSTVLTHSRPGTLVALLTAPSNVTVTLTSGNGLTATNAFAGTRWDDRAARTDPTALVTTHHYLANQLASPLAPEGPLSALVGKPASGTWLLKVADISLDTQQGVVGPVVLHIETAHCFPNLLPISDTGPSYPRLGQTALLGLGAKNHGITGTTVSLTATLNPQMRYQAIQSGAWLCATPPINSLGGELHCTRPGLGTSQSDVFTVTITAPPVALTSLYTVTVSSSPTDTDPSDNTSGFDLFTYAESLNHTQLDVQSDTGAMDEGGEDAFDDWGFLRLEVFSGNVLLSDTHGLDLDFGLVFSQPGQRWTSTLTPSFAGVQVSRAVLAPPNQNWVRYVDTFHNSTGSPRTVFVDWGGNLGSDENTDVQASSSGDAAITPADTWAVTQEDMPLMPVADSPVGYVLRSPADTSYRGAVESNDSVITATWAISGDENLGHLYTFGLAAGQTRRLAYFVYRGLAEGYPGPVDCVFYGNCVTPLAGSQVALADTTVAALAAQPALCDLSIADRATLVNWANFSDPCGSLFLPVLLR